MINKVYNWTNLYSSWEVKSIKTGYKIVSKYNKVQKEALKVYFQKIYTHNYSPTLQTIFFINVEYISLKNDIKDAQNNWFFDLLLEKLFGYRFTHVLHTFKRHVQV